MVRSHFNDLIVHFFQQHALFRALPAGSPLPFWGGERAAARAQQRNIL
jgi:hypothetical protein